MSNEVKRLKKLLFKTLETRRRNSFVEYWDTLQKFFALQFSKNELEQRCNRILGPQNRKLLLLLLRSFVMC